MKHYSEQVIDIFNKPEYIYTSHYKYNFLGHAGDVSIGEYVNLYLDVDVAKDKLLASTITTARFSAIGSVMLIAAADYLCSMLEGITLQEALLKVDPEDKAGVYALDVLESREHSFNFIIQALYSAIEAMSNGSITNDVLIQVRR